MAGFDLVAIVGTGLIGGSLGLAIKEQTNPPTIVGYNRRLRTSMTALEAGAIDEIADSAADAAREADLIFVCTPVGSIVDTLRTIAGDVKKGAVVTDVGSTKADIVATAERLLSADVNFIGGHPMAGSEREGIDNAAAHLFVNAYYLLTPTHRTDMTAFGRLHSFLTALGPTVLAMQPEAHDKAVATISHVPHLLSAALVNLAGRQAKDDETLLRIAAGGFKDMTRIAAGNSEMWADICMTNSAAILELLDRFTAEIARLSEALRDSDRQRLVGVLEEAKGLRTGLPALWQKEAVPLAQLEVPVLDRPGVISEITLTIGQLGVNIEDIELAHASEAAATLRLVVEMGPNLDEAVASLKAKGYDAQLTGIEEG
ncbi:MAG: prephenate dehydrogenase [Actinobacteria bacterium]|nr:MAG: prephenate dehydrogenase [Actinomycetota bacterium]